MRVINDNLHGLISNKDENISTSFRSEEVEVIPPATDIKRDRAASAYTIAEKSKRIEYVPTDKEQALLNVLIHEDHRLLPVTKRCEIAGISRESYYRMMRKPGFYNLYKSQLYDLIRLHAGGLVSTAIDHAKRGSFPHLKMLMEMGGLYVDSKQVEHSGDVTISVRFVDPDLADDEDEG